MATGVGTATAFVGAEGQHLGLAGPACLPLRPPHMSLHIATTTDDAVDPMHELAVFDYPRLRLDLGEDDALIAELVDIFVPDASRYVRAITNAVASNDARALFEGAHALKGGSRVLTAARVAAVAETIEQSARAGVIADAEWIARLQVELTAFRDALTSHGLVSARAA